MKRWTISIWVTGWDDEDCGTSRHAEFERDARDGAHGFALSEVQRLIDDVQAEVDRASPDEPNGSSKEDAS